MAELGIPIDYHILFLAMSFIIFILTIILLFVEASFEKAVGAFILCCFNIVLCLLCAFIFSAVDLYGFDTTGATVHNIYGGMNILSIIYVVLIYINILLMVYCGYLFIRKPWEEMFEDEPKIQY